MVYLLCVRELCAIHTHYTYKDECSQHGCCYRCRSLVDHNDNDDDVDDDDDDGDVNNNNNKL